MVGLSPAEEQKRLEILKTNQKDERGIPRYSCMDNLESREVTRAVMNALHTFELHPDLNSEQIATFNVNSFPFLTIVSAQRFLDNHKYIDLRDVIPENPTERTVAVITRSERKLFNIDSEEPFLFSIMKHLLKLRDDPPQDVHDIAHAIPSINEIYGATKNPFLLRAKEDRDLGWLFDSFKYVCQAFQLRPIMERKISDEIRFEYINPTDLDISAPVDSADRRYDNTYLSETSARVVLQRRLRDRKTVLDPRENYKVALFSERPIRKYLLAKNRLKLPFLDTDEILYDLNDQEDVKALIQLLLKIVKPKLRALASWLEASDIQTLTQQIEKMSRGDSMHHTAVIEDRLRLKVLRTGQEDELGTLDPCVDMMKNRQVVEAIIMTLTAFKFFPSLASEQRATFELKRFSFPTIVSVQRLRNRKHPEGDEYDIIPEHPVDRTVAVVTPYERRLFNIETEIPFLYNLMKNLVDLRENPPRDTHDMAIAHATPRLEEIYGSTRNPFLLQAKEDWELGWRFDGLANICRAFQFRPRTIIEGSIDIRFKHIHLADLAIRPLEFFLFCNDSDLFKEMTTPCVVLKKVSNEQGIPFNLSRHPSIIMNFPGHDLKELLSSGMIKFNELTEDDVIYNLDSPKDLMALVQILLEKSKPKCRVSGRLLHTDWKTRPLE